MHPSSESKQALFKSLALQAGVALAYVLLAKLALTFYSSNGLVGIIWPASGLVLAALLLGGTRFWMGIFAGAMFIELWVTGHPLLQSFAMATGMTLEPLLGAWILKRSGMFDLDLNTSRSYFLLLFSSLLAPSISAVLGATSLLLAGDIPDPAYPSVLVQWWMGNTLGIALITPLILVWRKLPAWPGWPRALEAAVIFGLTILLGQIVFLDWFHSIFGSINRGYWMYLFITFSAVRLGRHGVLLVLLLTAMQALVGITHGSGFFANDMEKTHLSNFWFYTFILSVTGLSLATVFQERLLGEAKIRESEAGYRSLFENMMSSVVHARIIFEGDKPVDMEYLSTNPAFATVSGITEPVVGRRISEVIPGYCKNNAESLEIFGRVATTGVPTRWEHYLRELDRWFSFMIYSPRQGEIILLSENITERKQSEEKLRQLSMAVEQSPESIAITDIEARLVYVNESFVRNTGYNREEAIGQNPRVLHSGKTPKSTYEALWQNLTMGKSWQGEFYNKRKDGSEYIENATISPIRQSDGRITHYLAIKEDITKRKNDEAEIHRLAFYDTLTSLPNRALLLERMAQTLATTRRLGHHSALISFNIDRFKTINDAGGQNMGDALLKSISERLTRTLREGDVVARIAGDEFAILLPDLAPKLQDAAHLVLHVAEKIHASLHEPFRLGNESITFTACLGVALFPDSGTDSPLDILRRANTSLHHSKTRGRGQTAFFEGLLDDIAKQRFDIERELHQAIVNGELRVFLQPQVDATKKVVGAEALVRWQHPQRGLVPPSAFIPIAEDSNLIVEIGTWVFIEVCRMLARDDMAAIPIRIAVNISPRHFRQPDFVDQIKHGLTITGADPTHLTLEITEGLVIDNINDVISKMGELSAMGIHFSMDDFGTGYSSLSYLKRLPIHELKIDKSFIQDVTTDPNDAALVDTILLVAQHLHLKVVAEGVETTEQAAFLNQRGHVIHQGYLFGKPEPAATVLANIVRH